MKQKCPQCGEWCYAEERSFREKALTAGGKVINKGAEIGGRIGSVFGKNGENLGRMIGAGGSGNLALVNGLLGGVAYCDCHFECSSCGYEWDANIEEDQEADQMDEANELIDRIASLANSMESEDDYDEIDELCGELDRYDVAESMYWRAKAQYNVGHIIWGKVSGAEGVKYNEIIEEKDNWFSRAHETIEKCLEYYTLDADYYIEKDGLLSFDWACNQEAWILSCMMSTIDDVTFVRDKFIQAMDTEFESVRDDARNGYEKCTSDLLRKFDYHTTVMEEWTDFLNSEDEDEREIAG